MHVLQYMFTSILFKWCICEVRTINNMRNKHLLRTSYTVRLTKFVYVIEMKSISLKQKLYENANRKYRWYYIKQQYPYIHIHNNTASKEISLRVTNRYKQYNARTLQDFGFPASMHVTIDHSVCLCTYWAILTTSINYTTRLRKTSIERKCITAYWLMVCKKSNFLWIVLGWGKEKTIKTYVKRKNVSDTNRKEKKRKAKNTIYATNKSEINIVLHQRVQRKTHCRENWRWLNRQERKSS